MKEHGPHICSALSQFKRKVDALGSWNEGSLHWNLVTVKFEDEFEHFGSAFGYGVPVVGVPENQNLSSVQKELLRWNWKLGITCIVFKSLCMWLKFAKKIMPSLAWIMSLFQRSKPWLTVLYRCVNHANFLVQNNASLKPPSPRQYLNPLAHWLVTNTMLVILFHWISMLWRQLDVYQLDMVEKL